MGRRFGGRHFLSIAAVITASAGLSIGCGGSGPDRTASTQRADSTGEPARVVARVPAGWDATTQRVSGLIDPQQLLTVGSFDLGPAVRRGPKGGCVPVEAEKRLPATGALITVLRYGRSHLGDRALSALPRRPADLGLSSFRRGPFECGGDFELQFRENGRGYIIKVWLDPNRIDPRVRRQTVDLLNGLELGAERP